MLGSGLVVAHRSWGRVPGGSPLQFEVGVEIDLRGLDRGVPEPERDARGVDPGVQERHRAGVPQGVRGDVLPA